MPKIETDDPHLPKLLNDSDEPMFTQSNKETDDPRRAKLLRDMEDPRLA